MDDLPPELRERVKRIAQEDKRTPAQVLYAAVQDWLRP